MRRDAPLWALSAAALAFLAAYLLSGHGRLDFQGYALGRDFVNAWTAGHLVREGRTLTIFDPAPFLAAARRLFDPGLPFHFWSYPPPTLLMVAPLGWTGYFQGLALWTLCGLVALALALATFARAAAPSGASRPLPQRGRRPAPLSPPPLGEGDPEGVEGARAPSLVWLVLLAPATATNVGLGQNGAFSAALLIGGLALVERRPWIAGALLGLLIFKPQIAILLPVLALAGWRWRVIGGAAISVLGVAGATTLVFGAAVWGAFLAHTLPMQTQMLRFGAGPFQTMMPSAYMAARVLGAPWLWALVAQAPFSLAAVVATWSVWRRRSTAPFEIRAAVLMAATFVASPQAFNYDLAPVALAAAVLWRVASGFAPSGASRHLPQRGRRPAPLSPSPAGEGVEGARWRFTDRTLAALAWIAPAVMAASALGPVGAVLRREPVAPLIVAALMLRLAWLGGGFAPYATRRAKASTTGQAASNT